MSDDTSKKPTRDYSAVLRFDPPPEGMTWKALMDRADQFVRKVLGGVGVPWRKPTES